MPKSLEQLKIKKLLLVQTESSPKFRGDKRQVLPLVEPVAPKTYGNSLTVKF